MLYVMNTIKTCKHLFLLIHCVLIKMKVVGQGLRHVTDRSMFYFNLFLMLENVVVPLHLILFLITCKCLIK